jgi:hypothetical protein
MYAYMEQGYDAGITPWLRVKSLPGYPQLDHLFDNQVCCGSGIEGLVFCLGSFEAILRINKRQLLGLGYQRHQCCTAIPLKPAMLGVAE